MCDEYEEYDDYDPQEEENLRIEEEPEYYSFDDEYEYGDVDYEEDNE